MDIGTAKPERRRARARAAPPDRHRRSRRELFRRALARRRASAPSRRSCEEKRLPLLVGGTMLYYRALVAGLDALPQADARSARRDRRRGRASAAGRRCTPSSRKVDPAAAARIAPNDAQRIQRALEVYRSYRQAASRRCSAARATALPFAIKGFALVPERARAAPRIERALRRHAARRVGRRSAGSCKQAYRLHADLPSMRAVGYRQVWAVPRGRDRRGRAARAQAIAATRQLAKRQLTWLRSLPGLEPAQNLEGALTRA